MKETLEKNIKTAENRIKYENKKKIVFKTTQNACNSSMFKCGML